MNRPRRVLGGVLAVMLSVCSLHAVAETQRSGRDFNHAATGFPLNGGHATAACETCHVAGVFKGTPKTCDGCHALGKRVVATPKSSSHIVTDAPCDSCHFNASTFLGARFNHGTALPGQCRNCHNGRQSTGKPASHSSGNRATKSCDQCHRSYTWFQASWNHIGVAPGTCASAGCHVQGSNPYYRGSTHTGYKLQDPACDDCHNFVSWSPAPYKHNTGAPCSSCHGTGLGLATEKGPTHGSTTAECNTCHHNTVSWLGASYHNGAVAGICGTCHNGTNGVKGTVNDPNGQHIPLTAGGNPNCDLCHRSTTTFTVYTMNHGGLSTCNTCHSTTSPYVVTTKRQLGNHQGSTTAQDCSNCHTSTGWAGALGSMPSNHIPYNAGVTCSNCHTGSSTVNVTTLHTYSVATYTCANCHITPTSPGNYTGNNQRTRSSHDGSSGNNCTGCHEHSSAGSYGGW
jgi:hypothetical protein